VTSEEDFKLIDITKCSTFQAHKKRDRKKNTTFGITGMSSIPHFGWKPIPKNPIPISSATALTYKHKYMKIITDLKEIGSLIR